MGILEWIARAWKMISAYFRRPPSRPVPATRTENARRDEINAIQSNMETLRHGSENPKLVAESDRKLKEVDKKLKARVEAESKLKIDKKGKYNFAFCGDTGAGKSSLVNGLRKFNGESVNQNSGKSSLINGLPEFNDESVNQNSDSAPVGDTECTKHITAYTHPILEYLVLWDIPGAGTMNHPAETYYEDKALFAFDGVMIVVDTRIPESSLRIARNARDDGKSILFLQNRAQLTMAAAAERLRSEKLAYFKEELSKAQLPDIDMLLLSSHGFSSSESPYIYYSENGVDSSLETMDEEKLLQYMKDRAAARTHEDPKQD